MGHHSLPGRFGIRLSSLVLASLFSLGHGGPQVVCHYHYGGEDKLLVATATSDPYQVVYQKVGTWVLVKIVFQDTPADLAAVKIYVAGSGRDGPVLVHQATYDYPAATAFNGPHGFTGLNFVYEPELSGEFIYWCRMGEEQP